MIAPNYQDIGRSNVVLLSSHDGGALVRLIAGELGGFTGPGITQTPITLLHASLSPGSRLTLPWRKDFNALAYVLPGRGSVGADRQPIESGQLAVFDGFGTLPGLGTEGETSPSRAAGSQESRSPNLEVIVLGGRPIGEPVAHYGPFVMNTQEELSQGVRGLPGRPAGHHPGRHGCRGRTWARWDHARPRSGSGGIPAGSEGARTATAPSEAGAVRGPRPRRG